MLKLSLITILYLLIFPAFSMNLETYLQVVKEKNLGVTGAKKSFQGKALRVNEYNALFKPNFFLNGQYIDDQRPTNAPAFQGTQTVRKIYAGGFTELFPTGTKATLSYNVLHTQINGAAPAFLPRNSFYDLSPQLELTQSLWRNFFGAEDKSIVEVQKSQTEAAKLTDLFRYKDLLMKAENAYWRYMFAQVSIQVQEESLERAKKLRDWNSRRVSQGLTDETDFLQAESNVSAREIEFQNTQTELESARNSYVAFLEDESTPEVTAENVLESQQAAMKVLAAEIPKVIPVREDVLIAMQTQRATKASAQLGLEKNKPNLELYGTYALNGRATDYSGASDQSLTQDHPYKVIGLRLNTPIDFFSAKNHRTAYQEEKIAADMNLERKKYEVQKEWEDLTRRFTDYKKRLKLSLKMEEIQKRKLTSEKDRYSKGRTTTFQVLQFEQDFANAQLLKLRNEQELIMVFNQLKMFSGDYNE